jgi:hypothetical protein
MYIYLLHTSSSQLHLYGHESHDDLNQEWHQLQHILDMLQEKQDTLFKLGSNISKLPNFGNKKKKKTNTRWWAANIVMHE